MLFQETVEVGFEKKDVLAVVLVFGDSNLLSLLYFLG